MSADKYRDQLYNPDAVQFPSPPPTPDQVVELGIRFAEDAENMSQQKRLETFAALAAALSAETVRANSSIQFAHVSQALIRLADNREKFSRLSDKAQKIIAQGDGADLFDKVKEKYSDEGPLTEFNVMVMMWGGAALNRGISYEELHDHLILVAAALEQGHEEGLY